MASAPIPNSLKFSKRDTLPVIQISAGPADGNPGFTRIVLSDNGIGFDTQHAEKIFDAFSRLHSKDLFEGTGLGLALCKKIVERHHGTIQALGTRGEGATFIFTLPLEAVSNEPL